MSCSQHNKSIRINATPEQHLDFGSFNVAELNLFTAVYLHVAHSACTVPNSKLNWRETARIPTHVIMIIRCYVGRCAPNCASGQMKSC